MSKKRAETGTSTWKIYRRKMRRPLPGGPMCPPPPGLIWWISTKIAAIPLAVSKRRWAAWRTRFGPKLWPIFRRAPAWMRAKSFSRPTPRRCWALMWETVCLWILPPEAMTSWLPAFAAGTAAMLQTAVLAKAPRCRWRGNRWAHFFRLRPSGKSSPPMETREPPPTIYSSAKGPTRDAPFPKSKSSSRRPRSMNTWFFWRLWGPVKTVWQKMYTRWWLCFACWFCWRECWWSPAVWTARLPNGRSFSVWCVVLAWAKSRWSILWSWRRWTGAKPRSRPESFWGQRRPGLCSRSCTAL